MIRHSLTPTPDNESASRPLLRRGFAFGFVNEAGRPAMPSTDEIVSAWKQDRATMLPGLIDVAAFADDIAQAHKLMEQTLNGAEVAGLLEAAPYAARLEGRFPIISSLIEEHDEQGIEKLFFDAEQNGEIIGEDLWCKASWLSFHDEDASLRFRFSFGMEGYEDVAADTKRQLQAAELTDAMFPESAAITRHDGLNRLMAKCLDSDAVAYTERIVYFNAPNGGAQMHHDVERGHAGVVFAQMSGSTFWLALAKPTLIDEIIRFLARNDAETLLSEVLPDAADREDLRGLAADRNALAAYMDQFDHELVEAVMDRIPAFIGQLVERGYAYILRPGDALLLPQRDLDTCVWHTVFCLGDTPGEALSFAVRGIWNKSEE